MSDYDDKGRIALWKGDRPNGPVLRGEFTAHRDIRAGEKIEVALWKNDKATSDKAPALRGKISDRYGSGAENRQNRQAPPMPRMPDLRTPWD